MMGTIEKTTASADNEHELIVAKLAQIDGIAKKTAGALNDIGLRSYADLIEYLSKHTAEDISDALKEHGVNRPPAFIKKDEWTAQARSLGQGEDSAAVPAGEETGAAKKLEKASEIPVSREKDAVFTVSFDLVTDEDGELALYTTVYDEKNSGEEVVFQGPDTGPWVNWIVERAKLPAAAVEPSSKPVEESAVVRTDPASTPVPSTIQILDVQVSEVPNSPNLLKRNLLAEIRFRAAGAEAEQMTTNRIPYRIEVYTIDLESSDSNLVSSARSQLKPQVYEYADQIEFPLPGLGRYELHTIVLLLPPGQVAMYHRGPLFSVVP